MFTQSSNLLYCFKEYRLGICVISGGPDRAWTIPGKKEMTQP